MVLFRRLTLTKILLCSFIINYASAQSITSDHASSLQSSSTGSQLSSDIEEIPPPDQIFHSNHDEQWSNAKTFTVNKKQSPTLDTEEQEELIEILDTPIHTHDCNLDNTKEQKVPDIDTELNNVEEIPNNDLAKEPQILDLEASNTICIAGYDNEIYKLMYDIQTDQGTEVLIIFYVYKDSKYNYLGCSMIDLEILKQKLMKYSHYYILCPNYLEKYSKESNSWYIDDFKIVPNTKDGTNDLRNDQLETVFKRFCPNIDWTDIHFNNFENSVPTFSKNEEVKTNEGDIVLENTINNQDTDKYIELESRYDKENNRFEVHVPKESDIIFNPISFHLYLNRSCNNETTNRNADKEVEFNDDMNKNRVEVLKLRDKECIEDVYVSSETEKCVEENNDRLSVINNYDKKPHEIEAKDNDIIIGNLNDCKSFNSDLGSNKFIFDENVVSNDDKLVTINNVLSLDVSEPPGLIVKSNYLDSINDNLLENDLYKTQNLKELQFLPFDNSKYSDPQIICADLQLNTPSNINSVNLNPYNNNIIFNTPKYGTLSPNINSISQINNIANENGFLLKKNNDKSNVNLNYKPISPVNSKYNLGGRQNDKYNTIWSNNMENLKKPSCLLDYTVSSINSDNQLNIPNSFKVNSNNYLPNINLNDATVISNLNTKNLNYIPNDSENAVKQYTYNIKPLHNSVNNDYNRKPKDIIFCNLVNGKSEEVANPNTIYNRNRVNDNIKKDLENGAIACGSVADKDSYLMINKFFPPQASQLPAPSYIKDINIRNHKVFTNAFKELRQEPSFSHINPINYNAQAMLPNAKSNIGPKIDCNINKRTYLQIHPHKIAESTQVTPLYDQTYDISNVINERFPIVQEKTETQNNYKSLTPTKAYINQYRPNLKPILDHSLILTSYSNKDIDKGLNKLQTSIDYISRDEFNKIVQRPKPTYIFNKPVVKYYRVTDENVQTKPLEGIVNTKNLEPSIETPYWIPVANPNIHLKGGLNRIANKPVNRLNNDVISQIEPFIFTPEFLSNNHATPKSASILQNQKIDEGVSDININNDLPTNMVQYFPKTYPIPINIGSNTKNIKTFYTNYQDNDNLLRTYPKFDKNNEVLESTAVDASTLYHILNPVVSTPNIKETIPLIVKWPNLQRNLNNVNEIYHRSDEICVQNNQRGFTMNNFANGKANTPYAKPILQSVDNQPILLQSTESVENNKLKPAFGQTLPIENFANIFPYSYPSFEAKGLVDSRILIPNIQRPTSNYFPKLNTHLLKSVPQQNIFIDTQKVSNTAPAIINKLNNNQNIISNPNIEPILEKPYLANEQTYLSNIGANQIRPDFKQRFNFCGHSLANNVFCNEVPFIPLQEGTKNYIKSAINDHPYYLTTAFDTKNNVIKQNDELYKPNFNMVNNIESSKLNIINNQYDPNVQEFNLENNIKPCHVTQIPASLIESNKSKCNPYFTMGSSLPFPKTRESKFHTFYVPNKSSSTLLPMHSFYAPNDEQKKWPLPTQQNNDAVLYPKYYAAKSTLAFPIDFKPILNNCLNIHKNDIGNIAQCPRNNLPLNTIKDLPLYKIDTSKIPIIKSMSNVLLPKTDYMQPVFQNNPQVNYSDITQLNQNGINSYVTDDEGSTNTIDYNPNINHDLAKQVDAVDNLVTNVANNLNNVKAVNHKYIERFNTPIPVNSLSPIDSYSNCNSNIILPNLPKSVPSNELYLPKHASLQELIPKSPLINRMHLSSSSFYPLLPSPTNLYGQSSETPSLGTFQNFLSNLPQPVIANEAIKFYNPVTREPLFEKIPNTPSKSLANYVPVTASLSYDLPSANSFCKQSLKSPSFGTLESSLTNLSQSLSLKELFDSNTPKTSTSLPEIFQSIPAQTMANPVPVSILSNTLPASPTSLNAHSMSTPSIESLQNSLLYLPTSVITSSPINIFSNRPLESMGITNSVPLSTSSYTLSPTNSYQQPIKTPATGKLQNILENLPKPVSSYKSFKPYNPTSKPLLEIYSNISPDTISNPISLCTSYVPPPSPTNLYKNSLKTPSLGTLQNLSILPKPVIPYKSIQSNTPNTTSSLNILFNSPSETISISNIVPLDASLPYYLPLCSTNNYEQAITKSLPGALKYISKPPNESVKLNAVTTQTPLLDTFSNIPSESLVIPKTLNAISSYSQLSPIKSYHLPIRTPTIGTLQNFVSNLPESVTTESISMYPKSALSSSCKPVYLTSAGFDPKSSITSTDIDPPNYFTSFLPKDPLQNSFADLIKSITAKSTGVYSQISQPSSHNLKNPNVLPLTPSYFHEQPTEVPYLSVPHGLLSSLSKPGTPNSVISYIENSYTPLTTVNNDVQSFDTNSLLPNNYSQFSKTCNLQTPDISRLSPPNIKLPALESLNTPISSLTKSVYPNFGELFPQSNKATSFYDLKNINTVQPSTSSHLNEQTIKPIDIPQYPSMTAKSITEYPQLNTVTIYSNIQNPYLTLSSNNYQPSLEPANMPLAFPTKSVSTKSINIYPQSSLTSPSNIVNTPLSGPLIPISSEISENFISNAPYPLNVKSNTKSPSKSSFYPQVMTSTSYTDLAKSYALPLSLNVDRSSIESRNTPFSNPTDFPLKSRNIYSQSNFPSSNNILENLFNRPPSLSVTSSSSETLKNLPPTTLKSNQKLSTDLPVLAKSVYPQFDLASFYSNLKKPKPNIFLPSINNYPVTPLDSAAPKSYIQTYFPDSNIKIANNPGSENIFSIPPLNLNPNSAIPYTTAADYFNQVVSYPTFIEESRNPFSISPSISPLRCPTLSSNPIQKVSILNNPITYTTTPSYYTVPPNLISSVTPSSSLVQPLAEVNLKPIAIPDIPIFNNAAIANNNQFPKKIFKPSFISSLESPSGFSVGIPSLITQPTSAQSNLNLIPTSEIKIPINPTGSGTLTNENFQNPFVPSFGTSNIIPSSSPSVFQSAITQANLIPIPISERQIANNINSVQTSSPYIYNKPFEKDCQTYFSPHSFEAQNAILNAPRLLFQSPMETKPILSFPPISSELNDMIFQGDINSNPWQQSSALNLNTKPRNMLYPPNNYRMVENEKQNSPLSYNIDNLSNNIESDIIKNLKSSEILKNNLFNNIVNVSIPLGNIGIAKYINDKENTFVIKTDDPNINLKGWYSTLKVLKAKLIIEATDTKVANFMPIVYDKFKYNLDKVQEVAKNAVTKTYGEPLVIKGVYCKDKPYAVVNNVENALLNDRLNILWPTYCSCECEKSGCDCFFKNCY